MKIPTKEQILEAAESCPDAKVALKKLFPDAFQKEWGDITQRLKLEIVSFSNQGHYFKLNIDGSIAMFSENECKVDTAGFWIPFTINPGFKVNLVNGNFEILRRKGTP